MKDYIEDALTERSPEYAPIIARMEYEQDLDYLPGRNPYIHAEDVEKAIESHIKARRYGPHNWIMLAHLRDDDQVFWEEVDSQTLDYKDGANN